MPKRSSFLTLPCLVALVLGGGIASAETGVVEGGVGLSSMGATVSLSYGVTPALSVRAMYSGFNVSGTQTVDGVSYTLGGQLGGTGLLADYAIGRSGFFVSGGAFLSNFEVTGSTTASVANPVTIGSTTLTGGQTANATIGFRNQVAPMLTFGYSRSWGNLSLGAELGAIATGGLDVGLTATGVGAADINQEIQNIRNELGNVPLYPYVGVSASFRF